MPAGRFAAWLRVTPPPTTLAESSAIYKHLKTQGPGLVTTFIKANAKIGATGKADAVADSRPNDANGSPTVPRDRDGDIVKYASTNGAGTDLETDTASYYAVFTHSQALSSGPFSVPVYHNLPSPRDLDPFNIRGLQDRHPYPAPKTFTCHLSPAGQNDTYGEQIKQDNQYHGSFKVAYTDWLQDVYHETGAPAGVKEGLGLALSEEEAAKEAERVAERRRNDPDPRSNPRKERKIKMNSLMDAWFEAIRKENSKKKKTTSAQKEYASDSERHKGI